VEGNQSGNSGLSGVLEIERKDETKKVKVITEKFGIKDDFAGERIKDAADKIGVVGAMCAFIFGFLVWNRTNDLKGFLIGLLITAACIFGSYILVSILYSYGDMITIAIEQTRILKRLEGKEVCDSPNVFATQRQEQDKTEQAPSADTAISATAVPEAQTDFNPASDKVPDQDSAAVQDKTIEQQNDLKPELQEVKRKRREPPETAVIYDRINRSSHFIKRPESNIVCPICGREQLSENDECFYCNCKFIFDNEQKANKGKTA
jgi:hypothetical protein